MAETFKAIGTAMQDVFRAFTDAEKKKAQTPPADDPAVKAAIAHFVGILKIAIDAEVDEGIKRLRLNTT